MKCQIVRDYYLLRHHTYIIDKVLKIQKAQTSSKDKRDTHEMTGISIYITISYHHFRVYNPQQHNLKIWSSIYPEIQKSAVNTKYNID